MSHSHDRRRPVSAGQRIHSILYGGRNGIVYAIHGELMNPALAHAALEQCEYRALQMLLQDVHPLASFFFEGDKNKRPATAFVVAQRLSRGASGGGI